MQFKQAVENMAIIGKNFEVGVIESGEVEFCKHIPEGVSGRNHFFWWEGERPYMHFGVLLKGTVCFACFHLFSKLI